MNLDRTIKLFVILILLSSFLTNFTGENLSFETERVLISFESFEGVSVLERLGIDIEKQFSIIPTIVANIPISLISKIENLEGVKLVEKNHRYNTDIVPNDPYFSQTWNLPKISALEAWDLQTGSNNIVVAVIDEGIDINHEDLSANIWVNPGEIPDNNIDDDANGFVDDINGWNFMDNNNQVYGGDPTQDKHGTHVAGIIAGVGNNGKGIAGINWNVDIMPLKFIGPDGGSTIDAISAIQYAEKMDVDIISASWGGNQYSQALKDAINAFSGLFVAAAGNEGLDNDATPHFPSSFTLPNIISIASTDEFDTLSSFSNYGETSVDISAPGSNILSTYPGNQYAILSGTSMAAPHVSGAAALLLAQNPNFTIQELKEMLMNSSTPITSITGKTVSGGRLNVYSSLARIPPQISNPTDSQIFTGTVKKNSRNSVHSFEISANGTISASLSSSKVNIDMYLYPPGVDTTGSDWVAGATSGTNPKTLGWFANQLGQWSLRINYPWQGGPPTDYSLLVKYPIMSSDITPPSKIVNVNTTVINENQINLSWTASIETDFHHYKIYRNSSYLASVATNLYSDTEISFNTLYSYAISAVDTSNNEGALSDTVNEITTPNLDNDPPAKVVGLIATAISDIQIDLNWTANNEVDLKYYRIYRNKTFLTSVTSTNFTEIGLVKNSLYFYEVSAVDTSFNEGTKSNATAITDATPDTKPPAKVQGLVTTIIRDTQIGLSWTASIETDLSHYRLYRDGAFIAISQSNSYTNNALIALTVYSYQISAVDNSNNEGLKSDALNVSTENTPDLDSPVQVQGLIAIVVSDAQIDLIWDVNTEADLHIYKIYRDRLLIGNSSTNKFSDNALKPNILYSYQVSAVDNSSNEGIKSVTIYATTNLVQLTSSTNIISTSESVTNTSVTKVSTTSRSNSKVSTTSTSNSSDSSSSDINLPLIIAGIAGLSVIVLIIIKRIKK